jgi:type II secretion system protein H
MDNGCLKKIRQSPKGFTIIEILVVLALMGIITAIAGPRIGTGMRGTETRTSVRRFAAALRAARTIAVAHQARVLVIAELGGNTCEFRIRTEQSERHRTEGERPGGGGDGSISEIFDEPLTLEGDITFVNFVNSGTGGAHGRGAVMFLPQGNTTGGSFILGHPDGPYYEVAVDLITGRIHTGRMN